MQVDGRSPSHTECKWMLTDDLMSARKVDGSLQKVTWPHGKLTVVEGRSLSCKVS